MRPLPMDFPDDRDARSIDDTYMFGPSFLVHPVTRAMYRQSTPPPSTLPGEVPSTRDAQPGLANEINNTIDTYLPKGTDWYDFWTNQRMAGGQSVKKDCPLNVFPLYVRAGSIVPMGPVVQYATQQPDAPYEIRIYPGADAKFTVYEDDNETYHYEKGERATYDFVWNDAARTLSVSARQGSFPGMVATRRLNVVLATPRKNTGDAETLAGVKTVEYIGQPVEVKMIP
jgi:alpha-D-xyloside xylohydrolase